MDGFTSLNVGGRVIHLAEPWNNDGEDVVLWNEYTVQTDEFQRAPLDLAIEAEETTSEETDEVENEDDAEDTDDDRYEEMWWSRDPFFVPCAAWYDATAAIAIADGHSIFHGVNTPWDPKYMVIAAPKLVRMEVMFQQPLPFEQYENGEAKLPKRIGLWRAANLDVKGFTARHSRSPHGYNTYRRKDLVRVEPIREARRNRMN